MCVAGRDTASQGEQPCNQKPMGWIGSLQYTAQANPTLRDKPVADFLLDGWFSSGLKSVVFSVRHLKLCKGTCTECKHRSSLDGHVECVGFASTPPSPYTCGCYQGPAVICDSGFLKRNYVPRGTTVTLKDWYLALLMPMAEVFNDLTKNSRPQNTQKGQ